MLRRISVVFAALLFTAISPTRLRFGRQTDWLQFEPASVDGATPRSVISAQNVGQLAVAWRAALPEASDGSPVQVSAVMTRDGLRHLLIVNTVAGRVVALNAKDGTIVWQTNPPTGPRWTTSSPAVDPNRNYVFAYALDGYVHRYDIGTGREVSGPGWPALITRKGAVEKGSSNIAIATARGGHTYLYMTASAYPDPGDAGDYQGHLVTINIDTGEQHVFNALCSDKPIHFSDSGGKDDCASVQAGIWARAGAVYDATTDRVFVTTGNGPYNADQGGYDWGTSVIALRPDGTSDAGTPVDSYTPADYQALTDEDLDLSSTTIEPLPVASSGGWPRLGVQSGKDGRLRLLNLQDLSGQGGPRHLGGELQILDLPHGAAVLTQPTAWLDLATKRTWLFVANDQATAAYELVKADDGNPQLVLRWNSNVHGTTPVVVNGILYLAAPHQFLALRPTTGAVLWRDSSIGDLHWQSPIVVDDTVFVADNGGYVTAYSLPSTTSRALTRR